jgi:hypothetical protein
MNKNDGYVVNKILKWAETKGNTGKTSYSGLYSSPKKGLETQRKQG